MAKRRGSGEGSIYKRKGDGIWVGAYVAGYNEHGGRRRAVVYGKTRKAVADELTRRLAEGPQAPAVIAGERLRVSTYLDRWLSDVARPRIRPGTHALYERLVRLHVKPLIGGVPLRSLEPMRLAASLIQLEKDGASERMRQQVYTMLHTALRDAVRMRLLSRNPLDGVDRPRAPRREIRSLDADEARKLLETAAKDERPWVGAFVALGLGSGARLGELLGATWSSLDLNTGAWTISHALVEDPKTGKAELAETKTGKAHKVELPPSTVSVLRAYRQGLAAIPHPTALVFPDRHGRGQRRSNFHRRIWQPLIKAAGLPATVTPHVMRHSHATLLLASGTSVKAVADRLGHASAELVLTTYGHVLPGQDREAANRLDELLA